MAPISAKSFFSSLCACGHVCTKQLLTVQFWKVGIIEEFLQLRENQLLPFTGELSWGSQK